MKANSGNRKEARKKKIEGCQLMKHGKYVERQGHLLRKGKIDLRSTTALTNSTCIN
jgi:hypothetical protein